MRVVVFTMHYPFGTGGDFLVDEMKVATKIIDKITIVSLEKLPAGISYYVPENANVVAVREKFTFLRQCIACMRQLFNVNIYKEIVCGFKEYGRKDLFAIIRSVLLTECAVECLIKNEHKWKYADDEVIYYSYWL